MSTLARCNVSILLVSSAIGLQKFLNVTWKVRQCSSGAPVNALVCEKLLFVIVLGCNCFPIVFDHCAVHNVGSGS